MINVNSNINNLSQKLSSNDSQNKEKNRKELKEACNQFESIFLLQIFEQMQKTIPDGYIKKSNTEKMYQNMLNEKLVENMSKSGGIGLADMLYKQLVTKE